MTFPSNTGDNLAILSFFIIVGLVGYASWRIGISKMSKCRQLTLFQPLPIAAWFLSSFLALDVFKLQELRLFLWFGQLFFIPLATSWGLKLAQRKHDLTVSVPVAYNISIISVFSMWIIMMTLGSIIALNQTEFVVPNLYSLLAITSISFLIALAAAVYLFIKNNRFANVPVWLGAWLFFASSALLELAACGANCA